MVKAIILCCDNCRDRYCIGCQRCFTAARERRGEFEKFDKVDIVGLVGCGSCLGYIVPKIKLFNKWIEGMGDYDTVFIGKCIVVANEKGNCPYQDVNKIKKMIEETFGKQVVIGTHPW